MKQISLTKLAQDPVSFRLSVIQDDKMNCVTETQISRSDIL